LAVIVHFSAVGSVAELKQKKFKLTATAPFQSVHEFLRKQLKLQVRHLPCRRRVSS